MVMNPKLKRSLTKTLGWPWLVLFPAAFLLIARRQKDGEWGFLTCTRNPFVLLLVDKEDLFEWDWRRDEPTAYQLATSAEIWANEVKQRIYETQQVKRLEKTVEMRRN